MSSLLGKIRWRLVMSWIMLLLTTAGSFAAFVLEGQTVLWFGLMLVSYGVLRLEFLIDSLLAARYNHDDEEDD